MDMLRGVLTILTKRKSHLPHEPNHPLQNIRSLTYINLEAIIQRNCHKVYILQTRSLSDMWIKYKRPNDQQIS